MYNHQANAIIITCIDFRLQEYINDWIFENFQVGTFDRVALGGGVKNLEVILNQCEIAKNLHHIKKVVLINHEDCGAYGADGTYEKHKADLYEAKVQINKLHPELEVETYYLHLDGTFEKI